MKNTFEINEDILQEWKKSNTSSDEREFVPDGIMYKGEIIIGDGWTKRNSCGNEGLLWDETKLKILFIAKDQNSCGKDGWDLRQDTGRDFINVRPTRRFYRNLMYQLYGLIITNQKSLPKFPEDFSPVMELHDKTPYARINVKKEAGENKISNSVLKQYLVRDSDFIKKQLENLNPDILVCCGKSSTCGNLILEHLNKIGYKFDRFSDKGWVYYDEALKKIAIDNYHLSYYGKSSSQIFKEMMEDYYNFLSKVNYSPAHHLKLQ